MFFALYEDHWLYVEISLLTSEISRSAQLVRMYPMS